MPTAAVGSVPAVSDAVGERLEPDRFWRPARLPPSRQSAAARADQELLREYYSDYRETGGWPRKFPFETLDKFLANLDGDPNKRSTDHVGSFDWRYFLIEEGRSAKMPTVSVEFLDEIAYGCLRMVEYASNGNFEPSAYTHSYRLRWKRDRKRTDWLTVRMNSAG